MTVKICIFFFFLYTDEFIKINKLFILDNFLDKIKLLDYLLTI